MQFIPAPLYQDFAMPKTRSTPWLPCCRRLAMLAFRHKRAFLAGWLLIMFVVVGGYASDSARASTASSPSRARPRRTRSTNLREEPAAREPARARQIVFESPAGTKITDRNYHAAVEASLAQAKTAPQVAAVIDPFTAKAISPDGRTALAQVQYARQPAPSGIRQPARR